MNGTFEATDKQELIQFLLQKIFCIGQNQFYMQALHPEYQRLIELINQKSLEDRTLFVNSLEALFSGKQLVVPIVFSNLSKMLHLLYDSYLPRDDRPYEF